jgi:3-oxoacyl-[acyl-carrier protein] reductase
MKGESVTEERPVAVVTGGTRGIGRAVADRLAADGWNLMLSYRTDDGLADEARSVLEQHGVRVKTVQSDVSVADNAGALIEATLADFGKIDALVNNAGVTRDTLMMRMSEEDWDVCLLYTSPSPRDRG